MISIRRSSTTRPTELLSAARLIHCNHELADYIESLIGSGYKKNAMELEKLLKYKNDTKVLKRLEEIKKNNKRALKRYLYETQNLHVDEKFHL